MSRNPSRVQKFFLVQILDPTVETTKNEVVPPKAQFSRVPSRGTGKSLNDGPTFEVQKPTYSNLDYENKAENRFNEISLGQVMAKHEVETVSKAKYDELKMKYEELLMKFDDSKKKIKEVETIYKQEVQKHKETMDENRQLKNKIKELSQKPKPAPRQTNNPNEEHSNILCLSNELQKWMKMN